jgi:aerobic-type carbon monoxide dehydrogenase small subunit (CoxS/CutS family)
MEHQEEQEVSTVEGKEEQDQMKPYTSRFFSDPMVCSLCFPSVQSSSPLTLRLWAVEVVPVPVDQ